MWETIVVVILVALAAVFLIWRTYRVASGQTACQQGICEGCVSFGACHEKPEEACPLREEKGGP